jgi:hypothetical protein
MQLECVERTIGVLDEKLLRSIESLEYNSTELVLLPELYK